MPATVEEVKQLVREGFPDSEFDPQENDHRIVGTIIWPKFEDMEPEERNRLVTQKVRNPLGYRSLNIGFLLPLASRDEE